MVEEKTAKESDQERQLLAYIDVPYFRNNPSYIELWRRYYNKNRNSHILLLMYHKSISTFYHWIYIELSEHFLRVKEPELAHFVLSEAIKNGVYDAGRLREALSKVPAFKKKYTKGDMLCILDQKNISALGTVWNKYEERAFSDIHLNSLDMSFEMAKAKQYFSEMGIKGVSQENSRQPIKTVVHGSESVFYQTAFYFDCPDINIGGDIEKDKSDATGAVQDDNHPFSEHTTNSNKNPTEYGDQLEETENRSNVASLADMANNGSSKIMEKADEPLKGEDPSIDVQDSVRQELKRRLEEKTEVYSISKSPEIEPEFVVGGYVHVLQEHGSGYFVVIRIANDADITQTVSGKTYFMKILRYEDALLLLDVKKYDFCTILDDLYVIYELDKLGSLEEILDRCNNLSCLHYLSQTLSLVREYAKKSITIQSLNLSVNTNFEVVLTDFILVQEEPVSTQVCVERIVAQYFSRFVINVEGEWDSIEARFGDTMSTSEFRRVLLQHKADILNSL